MTNEEYKLLRTLAQEQMIADYQWLLSEPSDRWQWIAPKRWLIELVYDVNTHLQPLDEMLTPIPLSRLYDEFAAAVGMPPLIKPTSALSKLRSTEQRRNITPDCITRFYMERMSLMTEGKLLNHLIIKRLLLPNQALLEGERSLS